MNDSIFLGAQTMFGYSDSVQTYIQLGATILTFFSIVGLLISINLQRVALEEQTKVNRLQTLIFMKDLIPKISLKTESLMNENNIKTIIIRLDIGSADVIIHSFGWKEYHSVISNDSDIFLSYDIGIKSGIHDLKKIILNQNALIQYEFRHNIKNISVYNRDEYILEIIYSDINHLARYKSEYYIDLSNKDVPTHLIDFKTIK